MAKSVKTNSISKYYAVDFTLVSKSSGCVGAGGGGRRGARWGGGGWGEGGLNGEGGCHLPSTNV